MKAIKRLFGALFAVAILLASSIPAMAIGFEAETVYNSIFVIYSGNSLGSGFAIGENCIITNAHVISDKQNTQIATYTGEKYKAFVVAMDTTIDIAVLATNETTFTPLQTAGLSELNLGDDVYAIGAPNSLSYTLTKGVISSKERKVGSQSFIQTDAAINTGNSGGPLLNDAGKVIGVNSYKISNSEGIGLAIPIETVINYLSGEKIDTDENGNVSGEITVPETENDSPNADTPSEPEKTNKLEIYVLYGGLALSVALNIVLTIILVFQKRKNLDTKIDPSERTDFDIDILE